MILALRALGVGDLLTAVPALRGLRGAFPGHTLALAAPTWLTPLISLIGGVDRIVAVSGLDAASLPPASYAVPPVSLAVNLHGSGPESHRLLRSAAPDELWAFACPAAGHADGPDWDEEEHEVRRWCRLLAYYGVAADPSNISLLPPEPGGSEGANGGSHVRAGTSRSNLTTRPDVSDLSPEGDVSGGVGSGVAGGEGQEEPFQGVAPWHPGPGVSIIHPGAKSPSRRWPVERFAAVAERLCAEGHRVVITGSEAERELAVRVAKRAGLDESAVPRTGLGELAALVARARVVISGDTGIAHLASAYRTPSVVLFGPMSPQRWGPPDRPQHRAIWHGTRSEPGDSPDPGVHPALLAIQPDEVLDAAREVTGAAATL